MDDGKEIRTSYIHHFASVGHDNTSQDSGLDGVSFPFCNFTWQQLVFAPSLSLFLSFFRALFCFICLRIRRLYFVLAGVIRKLSNSTLESYHKHPILILVLVITVAHVEYQERPSV